MKFQQEFMLRLQCYGRYYQTGKTRSLLPWDMVDTVVVSSHQRSSIVPSLYMTGQKIRKKRS